MTRTRMDRVRTAAGAAQRALQQLQGELAAVNPQELAAILRELHRESDPPAGVFGCLAQLLTVAARAAERMEPDHDGDASCPLDEAAAAITDDAGMLLYYATRALDPHGERTP